MHHWRYNSYLKIRSKSPLLFFSLTCSKPRELYDIPPHKHACYCSVNTVLPTDHWPVTASASSSLKQAAESVKQSLILSPVFLLVSQGSRVSATWVWRGVTCWHVAWLSCQSSQCMMSAEAASRHPEQNRPETPRNFVSLNAVSTEFLHTLQ